MNFTMEELDYLCSLVDASADSLADLKKWEDQDIMTEDEIAEEWDLIESICMKIDEARKDADSNK